MNTATQIQEKPSVILYYAKANFSDEELAKVNENGLHLVFSKGKSQLVDEILELRPIAVAIDGMYCEQRSMKPSFLLQKLRTVARHCPMFLTNAPNVDHISLLADELVYAVIPGPTDLFKVAAAVNKYREIPKRGMGYARVRNAVVMPCLLKKIGSSGVVRGRIDDLSPKGMKIVVDKPCDEWALGDDLRFSIPRKTDSKSHLDGYGSLRWSDKIHIAEGVVRVQLGLEFTQLPQATLYEFLELLNHSRA